MIPKVNFALRRKCPKLHAVNVLLLTEYAHYRHDFNGDLGGSALADIRPGWQTESIMDEWARYAQSQMGLSDIVINHFKC